MMGDLEEILAGVIFKIEDDITLEEVKEAIQEREEPWIDVSIEAMKLAVNNALEEAIGKIEEEKVRVHSAYLVESSINIGLDKAKESIISLKKKYSPINIEP